MATHMDNYDTSSTGTDCELSVFYDVDLMRDEFTENFAVLEEGYVFYTDRGEDAPPKYVWDCFDHKKITEKQARQAVVSFELARYHWTVRDVVENFRTYYYTWKEYLEELCDHMSIKECMRDGFPDFGELLYDVSAASGSCQGDYCCVLYRPESMTWAGKGIFDFFSKLIYSAPVYARLSVDGDEYYLEEGLKDSYDYDKEELSVYINRLDIPQTSKEWAIENLPEYPEYI